MANDSEPCEEGCKKYWSVTEAAQMLNVSEEKIRRMCRSDEIAHKTKVGQRWAINPRLEWPDLFGIGGEAA